MPERIFTTILLLLITFSLAAVPVEIMMPDNTWLKTDLQKSDKEGNLTIIYKNNERILRNKDYLLVKIDMPVEFHVADKLYQANKITAASKTLAGVPKKYMFSPAKAKMLLLQAKILAAQSHTDKAEKILETLVEDKIILPELQAATYAEVFLRLGEYYCKQSKNDKAEKIFKRSFELAVPEFSAMAKCKIGEIYLKQGKTQEALNCFTEIIAVFKEKVPARKLAIKQTIAIYKKYKSDKLKLYEDMLAKEYPVKSK